jgi:hypothetical protein
MTDTVDLQTWNANFWTTVDRGLPNLPAYYVPALPRVVEMTRRRARVIDTDGRLVDLMNP